MKKLSVIAACMAVAVMSSCGGSGLGKVTMNSVKDTISYSIGMGRAVRVYKEQLPEEIIDSITIKSFMKGFLDASAKQDNSKLSYALGFEIGQQEMSQAFLGLSAQLFGEGALLNRSNYLNGFQDGMLENFSIMSFEEADEISSRLYDQLSYAQKDSVVEEQQSGKMGKPVFNSIKDTISYSIGMGRAIRVYKNQLPSDIVDQSTMKSFMKGFLEAADDTENYEKLAYAIGYEVGQQEMNQAFVALAEQVFGAGESFNRNNYLNGFADGMLDNFSIMSFEEADETSNRLYQELSESLFDKIRVEGEQFLEKMAQEEDVIKTESGLLFKVLKHGDGGPKPTATSDVEVKYRGELIDGTMFDESTTPITLNLGSVIPGWTEGVQLMSEGDKFRFYIPYTLGYGERGAGNDIKPYSALVFDVELVGIK